LDHYQALVRTICSRLNPDPELELPRSAVGGSTYTFDVWPEHPHYDEALGLLERFRSAQSELRSRIEAYNAAHPLPATFLKVVAYAGQYALQHEGGSDA